MSAKQGIIMLQIQSECKGAYTMRSYHIILHNKGVVVKRFHILQQKVMKNYKRMVGINFRNQTGQENTEHCSLEAI